ncbi:hypothetical protein J4G37_26660 [Microvirga sp. 3-52]|nr:hypothetical protein [Microvirga sp. 3-52]
MPTDDLHPYVAFAQRYGDVTNEFFNAYSAIARLGTLLEDAEDLKKLFDKAYPEEKRWHPWFGAEIISYYAVGFVTCLEWHARSRTTDLFTYKPSAIRSVDIQGRLGEKIVPQMVAQNATVAQLIGSAINIGNFKTYMSLLSRVLSELGIAENAYKWIKSPSVGTPVLGEESFEQLEELFVFRNTLVHEIGIQTLGHRNIREAWSPDKAISYGRLVLSLIMEIERALFEKGPSDFPNLVQPDGTPVSELKVLEKEIARLEAKLTKVHNDFSESNSVTDSDTSELMDALSKSSESTRAEDHYLAHAPLLHSRYIDLRTPLRTMVLRNRAKYLKTIIEVAGSHWELEGEDDEGHGS